MNKILIKNLLSCALLLPLSADAVCSPYVSAHAVNQSTIHVQGIVKDDTGESVIGAYIKVEGTSEGTVTDIDGKFSLDVSPNARLEISYTGYAMQKVSVGGRQSLSITMKSNVESIDEVVVVGFGVQKKVNLTGSVGMATAKDFEGRPVNNTLSALQGVIPGLNISNSSAGGELNAQKQFNVRGMATIGDGSTGSPLVLIDGMEGSIDAVNPQDIESVSVLKDAASSSIYGSRAPFGVILITTKEGKSGAPTINYNNSFRFNKPLFLPKTMNSWEYVNYLNDVQSYTSPGTTYFDEDYMQHVYDYYTGKSDVTCDMKSGIGDGHEKWGGSTELSDTYANMDWMNEYYRKSAFSQEHNLSVNGGTDKLNYYVSGNWLDQGGFMRYGQENYDRYTFMGKIGSQLNKYIKLNYTSRWSRSDYDRPTAMDGGFYDNLMRRAVPTAPKYDPNGYLMNDYNYIAALSDGGRYKEQNDVTTNQFKLTVTPLKNWNIIGEFNMRVENNWTHQDRFPIYAHAADDPNILFIPTYTGTGTTSNVSEYSYKGTYLNGNIYTNYLFTIDKNTIAATAGLQTESYKNRCLSGNRNDVISNDLPVLDLTTNKSEEGLGGNYQTWKTAGFFGRINYDYDSRYLLEVNMRYDGSSRFRKDHRWVLSPSFSMGWNVAREKFWNNLKDYVSMLKLRFSYGQLANQNTNSWYPTYRTMPVGTANSSWLVNGVQSNTASFPALISSTLTWEKVRSSNFGIDFGAFGNRLTGSFDYYVRKTIDMLGSGGITLPATLGASMPKSNDLSLKTYGWELTIEWKDRIGEFSYGARLNLSDDKTKIIDYPNREGYINNYIPGRVVGEIYGLTTVGIARTQEEMNAHLAKVNQDQIDASPWLAGDIMYADVNGDGKVTKGTTTNDLGDLKVIGNSSPRYRIGINLNAAWKGFDVSMFWQGVLKRDYYFNPYGGQGGGEKSAVFWGATVGGRWESVFLKEHLDYWRDSSSGLGENLDAYYARPLFYTNKNREVQTRYLQDASYMRLKNLQVGYTFTQAWLQKAFIRSMRVYFAAENLLTITSLSKVLDPESLEVSKMKAGASYPLSRTYSFGLNITF
jgi:TonB-linked SusC/RagA family outer membrane protein